MPGKEGFVLTGQLGDVMKESARIALTYVRAHADELDIPDNAFDEREFHVHVPASAISDAAPQPRETESAACHSPCWSVPAPTC